MFRQELANLIKVLIAFSFLNQGHLNPLAALKMLLVSLMDFALWEERHTRV